MLWGVHQPRPKWGGAPALIPIALLLFASGGLMPVSAIDPQPIELTTGYQADVIDLEVIEDKVRLKTSQGMVLTVPRERIIDPSGKWMERVAEYESQGRSLDAALVARLLYAWDSTDPRIVALHDRYREQRNELAKEMLEEILAKKNEERRQELVDYVRGDSRITQLMSSLSREELDTILKANEIASLERAEKLFRLSQDLETDDEKKQELTEEMESFRRFAREFRKSQTAAADQAKQERWVKESLEEARKLADRGEFDTALRLLRRLPDDVWSRPDVLEMRERLQADHLAQLKPRLIRELQFLATQGHFGRAWNKYQEQLANYPGDPEFLAAGNQVYGAYAQWITTLKGDQKTLTCMEGPAYSYQIYVPPDLDLRRAPPMLYGFHAAADGRAVVNQFKSNADRHGFLIAGNNNSENGPWDMILAAQDAMAQDVSRRFIMDRGRSFASGFSGAARASIAMASRHRGLVSGVIAQGAGGPNASMEMSTPFPILFLIGKDDPNFQADVPNSVSEYKKRGCHTEMWTYEGGHVWPPGDLIDRAVGRLFQLM